jgi:hypothetical protein
VNPSKVNGGADLAHDLAVMVAAAVLVFGGWAAGWLTDRIRPRGGHR